MSLELMPQVLDNILFDGEGYMEDAHAWRPEIAESIAAEQGMTLTDRHWAVIDFARHEWETNGEAPTIRRITKASGVDTKELYQLFPGGPGKLVARIAGLKKPTGCI